jgi:hypothetical protein
LKRSIGISLIGLFTISCALLFAPVGAVAQQTDSNPAALTLNGVKDRLKKSQKYIKQAKKSAKANDPQGLNTAIENYNRSMDGLNTAISHGGIQGTPAQQQDAYNRVRSATQKHIDVLNGLMNNDKIPDAGKAGISKALTASQTGQQTAESHLSQLQSQQSMGQANRPGFGQAGGMGRSDGMGHSGGIGGFGSGASSMGGPGTGASMGRAGGPPAGVGGGRPH